MWASRGFIPSLGSNWLVCATSRKHASRETPCLVRVWGHTPADERRSGGEIPGPRTRHSIPGKAPCPARKDAPASEAVVAWPVWPLPGVKEFSFRTLGLCATEVQLPPPHTHTAPGARRRALSETITCHTCGPCEHLEGRCSIPRLLEISANSTASKFPLSTGYTLSPPPLGFAMQENKSSAEQTRNRQRTSPPRRKASPAYAASSAPDQGELIILQ